MNRFTKRNNVGVAVYKTPYACENCNEEIYRLPDYGNGSPTDRLAEYEDADEAGLLFRLSCKPGDILYQLDKQSGKITPKRVKEIEVTFSTTVPRGYYMAIIFENAGFCLEHFLGKTVFFSKADAIHAFEEYQSRGKT